MGALLINGISLLGIILDLLTRQCHEVVTVLLALIRERRGCSAITVKAVKTCHTDIKRNL